jgi:sulfur carrier protein ThiS
LIDLLERLGFQPEEVTLAMVNHKSVPADWPVPPGDRLSLFPREYPIFADWLDHRLNV